MTTLGRVWYIALFFGMWAVMAYPVIYDIIIVTVHYVVTFTPKAYDHDAILSSTNHPTFYLENVYDRSKRQDSLSEANWNSWTIWNTGQLVISFATFVFYIYIIIAIIVAVLDDESGTYNSSTSLLNESYNMWIFFALNSIYLVTAVIKCWAALLSLETFNVFEENILVVWVELGLYVWDPDQRTEMTVEAYAEIVKIIFVVANYFVYWQMPEVFVLLLKS